MKIDEDDPYRCEEFRRCVCKTTRMLFTLFLKNSLEQRGRLYKGRDHRSKAKHIYARAVPFLRHASRKRHFTQPNDSDDERKRGAYVGYPAALPSRVYIGSRSEILLGMHAPRRSYRATLSGSYFVTANLPPRYTLANAAPRCAPRSGPITAPR